MASLPLVSSPFLPRSDFFPKQPSSSPFHTPNHTPPRLLTLSCNAANNDDADVGKLDRRNVLLGIGGLYGALVPPASSTPTQAPDLTKCTTGTDLNTGKPLDVNCCPPVSQPIDYKLPPVTTFRFRPAAHLATKEYIAKYENAISLMKALPDDDPRSFKQQASVHCAYCNLTYEQLGDPNQKLQIHYSWHFFPWHRWYLYFYERILGKLIDDPTFGIPFWNWDNIPGMVIPDMFVREGSPLNNPLRNPNNLPPTPADLNYNGKTSTASKDQIIANNLTEVYAEMVRNASTLEDFHGAKYVTGTPPQPGGGTVELGSHTAMHRFVGQDTTEGMDMGNLYSAGRDPLFYSHHVNVDRLWSIWRGLRGTKPKDFTETDWLDATYVFYDENKQLVKVKARDTVDNEKMGYTLQQVDLPWLRYRPQAKVKKSKIATKFSKEKPSATPTNVFPVTLDKIVKVLVDRPKKSRSKKEKNEEEEQLVIEGIEVDTNKFVKFDVFVNDEDDKPEDIAKAEYAGCFSQLPHKNGVKLKTRIRLGLNELLEDLEIEDDDKIVVALVPKAGGKDITIGGVKIVYA